MELSLEGKLGYDLEKLEPQLRPYLGAGVKLTGRDVRPFHLAGALVGQAFQPDRQADRQAGKPDLLTRLHGDAGLNWQSLQALGCQVGAADLRGQLNGGLLHIAPIEATLNQGRLRLEPSLRLDPLPQEVTLAKGRVLEHAHLTPAACASALGYALPVLAGVAQADGEISLDLQSGRLPLSDPAKGDVLGWLTIHSAQVSGGPLVQELSVLLAGPPTLTLAKDNVVPFRLFNGRVYHSGLELHFPELTIRTSGSVGLDGSLVADGGDAGAAEVARFEQARQGGSSASRPSACPSAAPSAIRKSTSKLCAPPARVSRATPRRTRFGKRWTAS